MAPSTTTGLPGEAGTSAGTRRDFLGLVTGAFAAVGTAAIAWTLVDSMNPAANVVAAGAPMDIDVSKIEPGQQIIVRWRGMPILFVNRTPAMLKTLRDKADIERLSDPNSEAFQQPPYTKNWYRSINQELAVLVGICTHLGCLPTYMPKANPTEPVTNWPGGYLCPCHGSKYDLAGRVYKNVPAPYNLPVPPYHFPDQHTVRLGQNPPGSPFSLSQVVVL